MNPTFTNIESDEDFLKFTISNINMSFANAIRRIIVSEIPSIVFRTTPHEKSLAEIEINTSRLNNEIIKQRLSCIPIHISDINFPYTDHEIHIDVVNNGDSVDYVTTKDFKVYNTKTETYLNDEAVKDIFPPDSITGDFIILTKENLNINNQILINNFPYKLNKLIEVINVNFLKNKYNQQSEIFIDEYKLDINSRKIIKNNLTLELTEKETQIITFLKNTQEPVKIHDLQEKVWEYNSSLETHTVETHIYRLRKKLKETFNDDNFIKSSKSGYSI